MKASTILVVLLTLSTLACNGNGATETFSGFTFGGGGKTYSCQPAQFEVSKSGTAQLTAGSEKDPTHMRLRWQHQQENLGKQIQLTEAEFTVVNAAKRSQLKEGTIVVQAIDGDIVHGSFDLTVTSPDGRKFPVRGSFTATKALPEAR